MQGADSAFADGPGNILSASMVVASSKASGQGVLVAFSQQVSARPQIMALNRPLPFVSISRELMQAWATYRPIDLSLFVYLYLAPIGILSTIAACSFSPLVSSPR